MPIDLGNCTKKEKEKGQQAAYQYLQLYCKVATSTGSSDYYSSKWGCKEKLYKEQHKWNREEEKREEEVSVLMHSEPFIPSSALLLLFLHIAG